jgi:acetoin utilization deacetylase AcuC-like enzyme
MNQPANPQHSEEAMKRRAFLESLSRSALAAAVGMGGLSSMADAQSRRESRRTRGHRGDTAFVCSERYLDHILSPYHPESPERLQTLLAYLDQSGLGRKVRQLNEAVDPAEHILAVHDQAHVASVNSCSPAGEIATLAVSEVLGAVKAVHERRAANAFAAVRPPGHHAHNGGGNRDGTCQGQGFCFYNNVAIAARYAQRVLGYENILICDWDYHYGNGTAWAFAQDPTVFFFSTHNWRTYPGTGDPAYTGEGKGKGYTLNVHLPPGAGDNEALAAWDERLMPTLEELSFKPDFVLVSAGFDSRIGDTLGSLRITDQGFASLTRRAMAIADEHCQGRLVSSLEGGYNIDGNARASLAHLSTLAGLRWRDFRPRGSAPRTAPPAGRGPIMQEGMLYLPQDWEGRLRRVAVLDKRGRVLYVVPGDELESGIIDVWPDELRQLAVSVQVLRSDGAEVVVAYDG